MDIQIVELSNKRSNTYNGSTTRSKDNATWENVVNIDLDAGDQVNVDSAIIHLRGISEDSTIELTGENNEYGLADDKVGIRFTAYVNDNGYNSVALPFVGANDDLYVIDENDNFSYPKYIYTTGNAYNYPELDDMAAVVSDSIDRPFEFIRTLAWSEPQVGVSPVNAGELRTDQDQFHFSYDSGGTTMYSPFYNNVRTVYSEKCANGSWNSVSGHKYTLADKSYKGPFRDSTDPSGQSNQFNGPELQPMYLDIKVDVNAPLFETPSTIANRINDTLNTSTPYGDDDTSPLVETDELQQVKLPALTGNLLKVREVNGEYYDGNEHSRLWGNIAFRDFPRWQGIDALMRCELAFDFNVSLSTTEPITNVKMFQPVYLMPNGHMDDSIQYPCIEQAFKFKYADYTNLPTPDDTQVVSVENNVATFTILPQYFLMCTNIKYTEDNIKRIQTFLRNTEKYDGSREENSDYDYTKWRSHWDIGFSKQAPEIDDKSRQLYWLSQGNYDVTGTDTTADKTEYAYSHPYHPYEDTLAAASVKMSTSRSDIPIKGYTRMIFADQAIPDPNPLSGGGVVDNALLTITDVTYDVHRFKDNKNRDARPAFFSKYIPEWKHLVHTDGIDMTDVTYGDDSLSNQYNVGVIPVNMYLNKNNRHIIDLTNTYWKGFMNNLADPVKNQKYNYLFKITAGNDADHQQYGGYSMWKWHITGGSQSGGNTGEWQHMDDMYIYSPENYSMPDGRDNLDNLKFDGSYNAEDFRTNDGWFVFDNGNDQRWVLCFWDIENQLNHGTLYYCEPGFKTIAAFGNMHDFEPLGGLPEGIGGTYYDMAITDLWIASTDPDSLYYDEDAVQSGVNNQNPARSDNPDNPSDTVCGFMLYDKSGNKNEQGGYDISSDFALPAMYNSMQAVSPSFMDNEAIWLLNAGRSDEQPNNHTLTKEENINYITVGANNPTFQFDNSEARCTWSNLHIPKTLGIDDEPEQDDEVVTTTMGNQVVKINDTNVRTGYLFNMLATYYVDNSGTSIVPTYASDGENQNYLLNYSIGGISFDSMYGEGSDDKFTDFSEMIQMSKDNWTETLFWKLGFDYTDLFPKYGSTTSVYDRSKVGSKDPSIRYELLKPLTTNPLIDISSAVDLSQHDYTRGAQYADQPLYSLAVGTKLPTNLDGSTSEEIVASSLPSKSMTSFYKVYCSLSDGNYVLNTDNYKVIAIVDKKFVSGDRIYGSTNPPFMIKIPSKVSSIHVEVRDNNGKVVPLDPDNTVFLKIVKNLPPPNN